MALSNDTNRNDYLGNGETTVFPFNYPILADADLVVTTRNDSNVETTLTLNTDYTVDGAGEAGGGLITLASGALTDGYALTVRRDMDIVQTADIRNAAAYVAATHEDASDRAVMLDQEQQEEIERSIRFPETDAGSYARTRLPDAAHRANKLLVFDAAGNANVIGSGTGYFASSVGAWGQTWLDDVTSGVALATLGCSALSTSYLDAGSGATIMTALGFSSEGQNICLNATAGNWWTTVGMSTLVVLSTTSLDAAGARTAYHIYPPVEQDDISVMGSVAGLDSPVDVAIDSGTFAIIVASGSLYYIHGNSSGCTFRIRFDSMINMPIGATMYFSIRINGVAVNGERPYVNSTGVVLPLGIEISTIQFLSALDVIEVYYRTSVAGGECVDPTLVITAVDA